MPLTDRQKLSHRYTEELRKRPTPAEIELCRLLDAAKISYVLQSSIYDTKTGTVFIADFRIRRLPARRPDGMPKKRWVRDNRKLYVEVDGGYHLERRAYDARRSRWIESHRDAVLLRFENSDVFTRPGYVVGEIEKYSPARKTARMSSTSVGNKQAKGATR